MKTTFIVLLLATPLVAQIPDVISRPSTENQFSTEATRGDISGNSAQGGVFLNPAAAPNDGVHHLTEFKFGHHFADYVTPYNGYTNEVLDPILGALYPDPNLTRSEIENSLNKSLPVIATRLPPGVLF